MTPQMLCVLKHISHSSLVSFSQRIMHFPVDSSIVCNSISYTRKIILRETLQICSNCLKSYFILQIQSTCKQCSTNARSESKLTCQHKLRSLFCGKSTNKKEPVIHIFTHWICVNVYMCVCVCAYVYMWEYIGYAQYNARKCPQLPLAFQISFLVSS